MIHVGGNISSQTWVRTHLILQARLQSDTATVLTCAANRREPDPQLAAYKYQVFVTSGKTLTIEPGTTVYASPASLSGVAPALIVEKGGAISAPGTSSAPITFTAFNPTASSSSSVSTDTTSEDDAVLELHVSNFAPTAADLSCLFVNGAAGALDGGTVLEDAAAGAGLDAAGLDDAAGLEGSGVNVTRMGSGIVHGVGPPLPPARAGYRMATAAEFLTATLIRWPPCANRTSGGPSCRGTLRLRVSRVGFSSMLDYNDLSPSTDGTSGSDGTNGASGNRTEPLCKFTFGTTGPPKIGTGTSRGSSLVCQAPRAPVAGRAPVLVSLNGVDYNQFPVSGSVMGMYALHYYSVPQLGSSGGGGAGGVTSGGTSGSGAGAGGAGRAAGIEPPGGPVLGGTLVSFFGSVLADFGQEFEYVNGELPPTTVRLTSMGSAKGGGYVANGRVRGQMCMTRGVRYTLEVVAPGNPLCLTFASLGGPFAVQLLLTTGPNINPLEYGEMSFVPDASLPSAFYYQSIIFQFDSFDPAVQRINLLEPQGTSRLQFNMCPDDPNSQLAPFLSRNGSVIETRVPPMPNGTRLVGVVFSPNGAEEDYVGPLNYTYHDELELHAVSPAGSPIDGRTDLLVTGAFLDQVADALTDDRVRCLFDASDSVAAPDGPLVLPQASPIAFRNTTHLICRSPPSWLGRPTYLLHGAPLRKEVRTVRLRVALNGVTGSVSSVPFEYFAQPNISDLLPRAGSVDGGTLVPLSGRGLLNYNDTYDRAVCRFGVPAAKLFVLNDAAALCTSPPADAGCVVPGVVPVQVALNGVVFGTLPWRQAPFEYHAPLTIRAVWPLGGVDEGGTVVTDRGSGFALRHTERRPYGAPDAPKCLFGDTLSVGWTPNVTDTARWAPADLTTRVVVAGALGTTLALLRETETNRSFVETLNDAYVICRLPPLFNGTPGTARNMSIALSLNGQQFSYDSAAASPAASVSSTTKPTTVTTATHATAVADTPPATALAASFASTAKPATIATTSLATEVASTSPKDISEVKDYAKPHKLFGETLEAVMVPPDCRLIAARLPPDHLIG